MSQDFKIGRASVSFLFDFAILVEICRRKKWLIGCSVFDYSKNAYALSATILMRCANSLWPTISLLLVSLTLVITFRTSCTNNIWNLNLPLLLIPPRTREMEKFFDVSAEFAIDFPSILFSGYDLRFLDFYLVRIYVYRKLFSPMNPPVNGLPLTPVELARLPFAELTVPVKDMRSIGEVYLTIYS